MKGLGLKGLRQGRLLVQIFWSFFKISPVTFGGGYAVIPLIEREVVERRGWVEAEELTDVFALSQSIPGAVAINSATFVGYKIAGVRGALAAMLGVLLPTFLIVLGLCAAYLELKDNAKIEAAFKGIRAAIVALIVFAGFKIGKSAVSDRTTFVTVCATVLLLLLVPVNPVLVIVGGAVVGVVLVKVKEKLGYSVTLEHGKPGQGDDYGDYFYGDGI